MHKFFKYFWLLRMIGYLVMILLLCGSWYLGILKTSDCKEAMNWYVPAIFAAITCQIGRFEVAAWLIMFGFVAHYISYTRFDTKFDEVVCNKLSTFHNHDKDSPILSTLLKGSNR